MAGCSRAQRGPSLIPGSTPGLSPSPLGTAPPGPPPLINSINTRRDPVTARPSSCGFLRLLGLHRLPKAITFPVHLEDVTTVCQTVQEGRCHPLALEHLVPVSERQVARDQHA